MKKRTNNIEAQSRRLAYILRHDNEVLPEMEIGGWLPVTYLMEKMALSIEEIDIIINSDNKSRFELSESGKMVRARYGHSVNIELNFTPAEPPEFLWHGSVRTALSDITDSGILPRSRQFVHLTSDLESATETGARHGEPASILVVAGKMYREGYKFYHVTDNIWLTRHVPCKYIVIQHSNIDV